MKLNELKCSKVLIRGHKHEDVDSIISMYLMQNLMTHFGYDAVITLYSAPRQRHVKNLIKSLNLKYTISDSDENIDTIYVDTQPNNSGHAVFCIDHHPKAKAKADLSYLLNNNLYLNMASSCCAYLVYRLMQEYGYPGYEKFANNVVLAMVSDTKAFTSARNVQAHEQWARDVIAANNLNLKALISQSIEIICEKTSEDRIADIMEGDLKEFDYDNHHVLIYSCYTTSDTIPADVFFEAVDYDIVKARDTIVIHICNLLNPHTRVYIKLESWCKYELIWEESKVLSRSKDICNRMDDYLAENTTKYYAVICLRGIVYALVIALVAYAGYRCGKWVFSKDLPVLNNMAKQLK